MGKTDWAAISRGRNVPALAVMIPVHHMCGSSAILNLSCSALPGGKLFYRNKSLLVRAKNHRQYGVEAAALGRALKPVLLPAAVCVLNTGNLVSHTIRCGREDSARQAEIHRDIDRYAVPISRELAEGFGLPLPNPFADGTL